MQRVTLKTSTIFIAKAGQTRVYHSVSEIPQDLRQQLEECTNGFNSATILIADRRGREEIRRALNGMPSTLRTRLSSSLNPEVEPEQISQSQTTLLSAPALNEVGLPALRSFLRRHWIAVSAPLAGLLLWAIAQFR